MPRSSGRSGGRGAPSASARRSLPRQFSTRARLRRFRYDLTRFDDRRRWHPSDFDVFTRQPNARAFRGVPRLEVVDGRQRVLSQHGLRRALSKFDLSSRVGFVAPGGVILCVRRHRRREVLHAVGVAGRRGVGRGKSRRITEFSKVRC